MARRDEEIFRKLKKETPLVKQKDIQPLSNSDFRKSGKGKAKVKRVTPKADELDVFSAASKRTGSAKRAGKRGTALAGRYNSAKKQTNSELSVFGESASSGAAKTARPQPKAPARAAKRPAQTENLNLFTEPAEKKEALRVDHGYRPAEPVPRVDQNELDYMQMRVQSELAGFPYNRLAARQEPAENGQTVFRHELKYYINYHDYVLLKNTIKALLSIDGNADGDGQYHIRSLYFDDACDTALVDKVAGNDERSKYRIRIYNYSDSVIRFEKKLKCGQFISKASIRLSRDDCENLIAGDFDILAGRPEPLASEIYLQMKNNALKPRVIVDYWREAYVSPLENVRITFDKDIKGGLWLTDIFEPLAPTMPILDEGIMVLEVKFNRYMPEFIKAILTNVNAAQRSAISKYVLCRKFD